MGLYQRKKMAIYYWGGLLIILIAALIFTDFSIVLPKKTVIQAFSFTQRPLNLSMDDWLTLSKTNHLHLLKFRPTPMGGHALSLQGNYGNLLQFLKNIQKTHPDMLWHKILLEPKDHVLIMHLEAGQ